MNRRLSATPARGLECPSCGCRHFFTTHTEPLTNGSIRRRKICRHCGRKQVTTERAAPPPPTPQPPAIDADDCQM